MGVFEVPNILQICFIDGWKQGAFDSFTSDKSSAYLNVHLSELNMTKIGGGSRHNFQKSVGIGSIMDTAVSCIPWHRVVMCFKHHDALALRYPLTENGLGQVQDAGLRHIAAQSPSRDLRAFGLEARMRVC